jgi:hypothetical protein
VFTITDDIVTSIHPNLQSDRLPAAHAHAYESAMALAHAHLQRVATSEGWNPEALVLHRAGAESSISLAQNPAGQEVFDAEYGDEENAPRPVLRGSMEALAPTLNAHYQAAAMAHLGL